MSDTSAVIGTTASPTRPQDGSVSIGVAIPVPEPWAEDVRQARRSAGDPQALVIPPHITLLPPTQVPARALRRIRHHLTVAGGRHPAFTIALRGTGTFRPVSPVVFLQVVQGGDDCDQLQQLVNQGILQRDLLFDYHPHVTLAHGVPDDALEQVGQRMAEFSVTFQVERFGLYRFDGAGQWRVDTFVALGSNALNTEHQHRRVDSPG